MSEVDEIVRQVAAKEGILLTPEIHRFAWAIHQNALLVFWRATQVQIEYQQRSFDTYMQENRYE